MHPYLSVRRRPPAQIPPNAARLHRPRWRTSMRGTSRIGPALPPAIRTGSSASFWAALARHGSGLGYLALRDLGLSLPLLRPALTQVWSHDHAGLVAAVGSGQVRRLFAELAFDMAHLPEAMTVYRGGLAPPSAPHVLARGFSWTLDQDVAAFFATRRWPLANPAAGGSGSPRPFVLATEITRGRVIHHDDGRQEAEVILRGRPGRFHILDDLDDILFRENRYCANKAQAQALALKSLAAKVPRHPTGG